MDDIPEWIHDEYRDKFRSPGADPDGDFRNYVDNPDDEGAKKTVLDYLEHNVIMWDLEVIGVKNRDRIDELIDALK